MKHNSVRLDIPAELINLTPFNPLISKCEIKVCYVSDEPNRNRTVITKETARQMANTLPGSPIVGYFNDTKQDFEEHNRILKISSGKLELIDTTRPYGFVDLNAKAWFQWFDDEGTPREYLMTEGWIWTGQYPESKRIIEDGNNQSMELDEVLTKGVWTKDENNKPKFFIVNEAIISKLCTLGEDEEPCFEGSQITRPTFEFSFNDNFKTTMLTMMNELSELLNKGGEKVATRYSVSVGDTVWNGLFNHISEQYPDNEQKFSSVYRLDGVYEENENKYAVIQNRADSKYYRINFSLAAESEELTVEDTLIEVTSSYEVSEEPQFAQEDVDTFENNYMSQKNSNENSDNSDENNTDNSDENTEGNENSVPTDYSAQDNEEKCEKCGKPKDECECDKEEPKQTYSLDEIPEYTELVSKYAELETKYNELNTQYEALNAQLAPLTEFKAAAEKKEKEAMIAKFYMLSDEDKKDVIDNIDTYSLHEIEAQLSILCVRNKVSFDSLEDDKDAEQASTTYTLDAGEEDDNAPAWVKRVLSVAKKMN